MLVSFTFAEFSNFTMYFGRKIAIEFEKMGCRLNYRKRTLYNNENRQNQKKNPNHQANFHKRQHK